MMRINNPNPLENEKIMLKIIKIDIVHRVMYV